MSTELYIPPTWAKVPPTSKDYVEKLDDPKRAARREHSRKNAVTRWARPGEHDYVDKEHAKPVDVFDMTGKYITSYPSARKAAEALFPGTKRSSAERAIRLVRFGGVKKSYKGYMFRDSVPQKRDIEPYKVKKKKTGYTYVRRPDTTATHPVAEVCEFGVLREWPSVKACAADLGMSSSGVILAIKRGTPCRKTRYTLQYMGKKRLLKKIEKKY